MDIAISFFEGSITEENTVKITGTIMINGPYFRSFTHWSDWDEVNLSQASLHDGSHDLGIFPVQIHIRISKRKYAKTQMY